MAKERKKNAFPQEECRWGLSTSALGPFSWVPFYLRIENDRLTGVWVEDAKRAIDIC